MILAPPPFTSVHVYICRVIYWIGSNHENRRMDNSIEGPAYSAGG
jgi:hypothetical protein